MEAIGERIKFIRQSNSMTQLAFSKKIGISRVTLSLLESGKHKPSLSTIRLIALLFNIEENWIRYGK